jgi:hypothetical protein
MICICIQLELDKLQDKRLQLKECLHMYKILE